MTGQTIHPHMDPADMVHLLECARHGDVVDVTGLHSLDTIRKVQAAADAADTCVWWLHERNRPTAVLLIDRTPS